MMKKEETEDKGASSLSLSESLVQWCNVGGGGGEETTERKKGKKEG